MHNPYIPLPAPDDHQAQALALTTVRLNARADQWHRMHVEHASCRQTGGAP